MIHQLEKCAWKAGKTGTLQLNGDSAAYVHSCTFVNMVDMFFCFKCDIAVDPNCIDPYADPVNDACLTKWECPACIHRAEDKKGASSLARKP